MLNHTKEKCGVYQYFVRTYHALKNIVDIDLHYTEVNDFEELRTVMNVIMPDIAFYNYDKLATGYMNNKRLENFRCKNLAILYDCNDKIAQELTDDIFDHYVSIDSTIKENNIVSSIPPLLINYQKDINLYKKDIPVIGTVGFPSEHKGLERIIKKVNEEFDEAIIRMHIPFCFTGYDDGTINRLRALNIKKGIQLEISQNFIHFNKLMDFLASNWINVFYYDDSLNQYKDITGISSTALFALSSGRPLGISNSVMFRNFKDNKDIYDQIDIDKNSLRSIIRKGNKLLKPYLDLWSLEKYLKKYKFIFKNVYSSTKKLFNKKNIFDKLNSL